VIIQKRVALSKRRCYAESPLATPCASADESSSRFPKKMTMSISIQQLTELGQYINSALAVTPCDHTLRNAIKWAQRNKVDKDKLEFGREKRKKCKSIMILPM